MPAISVRHSWCIFPLKVYPVGIPVTYFCILWRDRESLRPAPAEHNSPVRNEELEAAIPHEGPLAGVRGEEGLDTRWSIPELVPSILLWKDYSELWISLTKLAFCHNCLCGSPVFTKNEIGRWAVMGARDISREKGKNYTWGLMWDVVGEKRRGESRTERKRNIAQRGQDRVQLVYVRSGLERKRDRVWRVGRGEGATSGARRGRRRGYRREGQE